MTADLRTHVSGLVLAVGASRVTISVNGSSGADVPFVGTGYAVGQTVLVARNPHVPGGDLWVLGIIGTPTDASTPDVGTAPSTTTTATITVAPTWSGTWRADRSAYDRWNTSTYGGRSTLYQDEAHGSGALTGLAVYGNQITSLGATAITSMKVKLIGAGLNEASYPTITIRGATNSKVSTSAPSVAGSTFNGTPGKSGTDTVTLDSTVREAFRDGTYKGLALVGSSYGAVRGTSKSGAMLLTITYTKDN